MQYTSRLGLWLALLEHAKKERRESLPPLPPLPLHLQASIERFELALKGGAPDEGPYGLGGCHVAANEIDSKEGSVFKLAWGEVCALREIFSATAGKDFADFTGESIENMLTEAIQRVREADRKDAPPCASGPSRIVPSNFFARALLSGCGTGAVGFRRYCAAVLSPCGDSGPLPPLR
jgi:hypothetical protein